MNAKASAGWEGGGGVSRCAPKRGQISNVRISETAGWNPTNMVLKLVGNSNGKGFKALRGRIRKLVILGQDVDVDYGRTSWVGNGK